MGLTAFAERRRADSFQNLVQIHRRLSRSPSDGQRPNRRRENWRNRNIQFQPYRSQNVRVAECGCEGLTRRDDDGKCGGYTAVMGGWV